MEGVAPKALAPTGLLFSRADGKQAAGADIPLDYVRPRKHVPLVTRLSMGYFHICCTVRLHSARLRICQIQYRAPV